MTLQRRLHVYLIAVHVLLAGLALLLLRDAMLVFLALEVLLICSLALGMRLVKLAMQPLEYTGRFRDLIQNEDYAARLTDSQVPELDELVALFNTMLGTLYSERLALGEQRGFLDSLLEATPAAVIVFDYENKISLMNASATALLQRDDLQGRTLGLQLDALPLYDSRLLTDADGRRYRGQRGQFFDRGFARHFLLVDELTVELESSERATYDKLIRVLAHEVNNTVAATGSVLDSLLYYRDQLTERDGEDFSTAIVAVKRRNTSLGEFIERFTRVIKMPEPVRKPNAIAAMMDDILWLNREHCKRSGIEIGWTRCDAVAPQQMDSHLMEQALLNIVKNAVEAVEATTAETGVPGHVRFALIDDGERLVLSVTDSGNRLGELPARQLFTPFVSTKKGGQGIGLMFVREVLSRHNFPYRLAPTGDGETRFEISFPRQQ